MTPSILFNMGSTYVPLTKDIEQCPWQMEMINILSPIVDYDRPLMSANEYSQVHSNFQRAATNMVNCQIVQNNLDDLREETKKNSENHKGSSEFVKVPP